MPNRRLFLRQTGAFALGTFLIPSCMSDTKSGADTDSTSAPNASAASNDIGPLGVQLWSVKDVIEKDLAGTIKQLADIGYKEIESYPGEKGHYYGMEPGDFKKLLADNGLTLISSHVASGSKSDKSGDWHKATLLNNFNELVDKAAQSGQQYLTCSWLDESLRGDLPAVAELFNKSAEACKKADLQFAYHNHDFEFKKVGDQMIYDYMLDNTDKDLVKYEMDIYWVVRGGQDPKAYFEKYPGRFALGHIKDMDKTKPENNTEIGSGSIDYATLLPIAAKAGMKHFIVEQETFTRPSIESMKMNFDYLHTVKI